ncbi:MAG: 5' nucleotidase, NT5C type [Candidatus Binatia bacterium]
MRTDSKVIYVDMDDVLCHAARHFIVIIEREFGKRITYDQLTSFDVGEACGLALEERDELYRIVHRPEELLQMEPVKDALHVLRRWQKQGFEIAIVTGRPPESFEPSLEWLAKHRISHDSFTVVDKYSRFEIDSTMAISLNELAARRFYWAVEDSLPMAEYLAGRMKVPVALIDCPWNRTDADHAQVSRCKDWNAIANAVAVKTGAQRR